MGEDDLRRLLNKLVARFKLLDVTSVLTAGSLCFGDDITEHEFSPLADNLLMLRYVPVSGELTPALRIVKTRCSAHDRGTHSFRPGTGACAIAPASRETGPQRAPSAKGSPVRKPTRTKRSR